MPELPEVEIVKQSLDKNIKFQKIKKVFLLKLNIKYFDFLEILLIFLFFKIFFFTYKMNST